LVHREGNEIRWASNGPATDGPVNDVPANDGPVNDGPANDGPANDGPAYDGPANDGPANDREPNWGHYGKQQTIDLLLFMTNHCLCDKSRLQQQVYKAINSIKNVQFLNVGKILL
jgi:hypothetical protein